MQQEITEDNFNRLVISIIEKFNCSYEEAINILSSFRLHLKCGEKIRTSVSLQAALITAINTGKRAFLGGVTVDIESNVCALLPWPQRSHLHEIALELGATIQNEKVNSTFTLTFGLDANIDENTLEVLCNSWQGGVIHNEDSKKLIGNDSLPMGGVAAGAIAVGIAFLRVSKIDIAAGSKSTGVSLWSPGLNWYDTNAQGENIELLPKKIWMLGLGHLGQAFIWNFGLLPYSDAKEINIILQDFDKIVEANESAGLLCSKLDIGNYKTRVCTHWLEERGFTPLITERKFDENTVRIDEEPFIALCGFDSAPSRSHLECAGFDLIIEAALGGSLFDFDEIILHTFPNATKKPVDIWGHIQNDSLDIHKVLLEKISYLEKNGCGVLANNISQKAISTSFVGALAGALVIAELLKATNTKHRCEKAILQIRNLPKTKSFILKNYDLEAGRNGFTYLK